MPETTHSLEHVNFLNSDIFEKTQSVISLLSQHDILIALHKAPWLDWLNIMCAGHVSEMYSKDCYVLHIVHICMHTYIVVHTGNLYQS